MKPRKISLGNLKTYEISDGASSFYFVYEADQEIAIMVIESGDVLCVFEEIDPYEFEELVYFEANAFEDEDEYDELPDPRDDKTYRQYLLDNGVIDDIVKVTNAGKIDDTKMIRILTRMMGCY